MDEVNNVLGKIADKEAFKSKANKSKACKYDDDITFFGEVNPQTRGEIQWHAKLRAQIYARRFTHY